MYGDKSATLLAQIVVLQSLIWYNLLLLLFELNATKAASETVAAVSQDLGDEEAPEEAQGKEGEEVAQTRAKKSKAKQIFLTVGKKLMTNPNTHATVLGLIWASVQFRWDIKFPAIVEKSIAILSSGGLGMAMFSLGLFMASRPSIIACGIRMAAVAMAMKFMAGPALMAAASTTLGLKGRLLRVAIVQAALPQGVVPFVFAKEYNIHPDILSTGVIFGAECATNPSGGVNTGIRESVSLRLVPGAERLWQNSEPVITVGGDRPTDPVVVRDWVESVIEPIPVESATANGDPLFATGSSSLGRHDEGEHSLVGDPGVTSSVGMAGNVVESNLGDVGCESGNNVHGVVIGSCDEVGMAAECDNSLHEEVPSSRGEPDMAVSSDPEEVVTPGCYDAVVVGYTTHRNEHGNWMVGFDKFIGICSILEAELWGAYIGLSCAWDAGFRQVILEMDSMQAVDILRVASSSSESSEVQAARFQSASLDVLPQSTSSNLRSASSVDVVPAVSQHLETSVETTRDVETVEQVESAGMGASESSMSEPVAVNELASIDPVPCLVVPSGNEPVTQSEGVAEFEVPDACEFASNEELGVDFCNSSEVPLVDTRVVTTDRCSSESDKEGEEAGGMLKDCVQLVTSLLGRSGVG
ncbi:hypothetical protein V6N11_022298 [Hibiscus sabdariffa]|uniref:RNase H type-1 domain-containing protein n=1 Tax=Hibiscus sabdariffa TaxID=183260 RepID=A0ABR2TJI5_9ROSI